MWDPLERFLHWTLIAAFALAYASGEDGWLPQHVLAGYVVAGVVVFHIAGAILDSFPHHENLVKVTIAGRKEKS